MGNEGCYSDRKILSGRCWDRGCYIFLVSLRGGQEQLHLLLLNHAHVEPSTPGYPSVGKVKSNSTERAVNEILIPPP